MVAKLIEKYENLMKSSDSRLKKKYMALVLSTLIGAGYFFGSITHASALSETDKQEALKDAKSTSYEQVVENEYNPLNNPDYEIMAIIEVDSSKSLQQLAYEYGVSVVDLKTINNYTSLDDYKPGNTIVIGRVKDKDTINVEEQTNYNEEKQQLEAQKAALEKQKQKISSNRLTWNDAMDQNGGFTYVIDVSGANPVDLDTILQKNPNISGVMIRTSYEWKNMEKDSQLDNYVEACVNNNCDFGFYCWPTFKNINQTEKELTNVFKQINTVCSKYNTNPTLPVAFDIEADEFNRELMDRINKKDASTKQAIEHGINMVKENGYYPMIYSGLYCVADKNGNALPLGKIIEDNNVDSWLARYSSNNKLKIGEEKLVKLKYPGNVEMYQFTGNGVVNGTDKAVDISVTYENLPEKVANFNKSR